MNKPDILVFSHIDHPRLNYILDWIICDCWKQTYLLTTDEKMALEWSGPRLAYTPVDPHIRPWIVADSSGFSDHNNVSPNDVVWKDDHPWIFYQPDTQASLPADILAGAFWFLSRVEEYGSVHPDSHGRFPAYESLAYVCKFLDRPIVDEWMLLLRNLIAEEYAEWSVHEDTFSIQATYDIDFAWRYLHKPPIEQVRTLMRDLLKEGPIVFWKGLRTVYGIQHDPYDLYEVWKNQDPVLFFPLGDKSYFDRNHSWSQNEYQSLIRASAEVMQIGIHPSYESMREPDRLTEEIHRFEQITGQLPIRSRQHYLRFSIPETFRMLEEYGIREEWSMGYADQPGFRAGTSHSFLWYDLIGNRPGQLRIFPFQVMDTTLLHYLKLTPAKAKLLLDDLISTTQRTSGQLTTLAHNNSMAGVDQIWKGWQEIWPIQQR